MGMASVSVGDDLVRAYRDLVPDEARLAEALGRRGLSLRSSVVDRWPVLHDHLHLYARGLGPAGMLVLGGALDAGTRATGIPFTGAPEARRWLGLDARVAVASPSGAAFWRAVQQARGPHADAPLEAFFGTVHLAHALPFDAPPGAPEAEDAARAHVLRLLRGLRPQAVVAVGAGALGVLGRALGSPDLQDLADAGDAAFATRWPPGTPLHAHPYAEVGGPRPFRVRVVPAAALDGAHAAQGYASLAAALARGWT